MCFHDFSTLFSIFLVVSVMITVGPSKNSLDRSPVTQCHRVLGARCFDIATSHSVQGGQTACERLGIHSWNTGIALGKIMEHWDCMGTV